MRECGGSGEEEIILKSWQTLSPLYPSNSRLTSQLCDFELACDIPLSMELKMVFFNDNCVEIKWSSKTISMLISLIVA